MVLIRIILTPQTAADLLLIFLCVNGEAMHKTSDGKAVQGAQRLVMICFVMCLMHIQWPEQ